MSNVGNSNEFKPSREKLRPSSIVSREKLLAVSLVEKPKLFRVLYYMYRVGGIANRKRTASELGISPSTLGYYIRRCVDIGACIEARSFSRKTVVLSDLGERIVVKSLEYLRDHIIAKYGNEIEKDTLEPFIKKYYPKYVVLLHDLGFKSRRGERYGVTIWFIPRGGDDKY